MFGGLEKRDVEIIRGKLGDVFAAFRLANINIIVGGKWYLCDVHVWVDFYDFEN